MILHSFDIFIILHTCKRGLARSRVC